MQIRKLFRIEAAHRVLGAYTERCQGIHGHSYIFEIFLKGPTDTTGMVIDFKLFKEKIGSFIDAFDHSLLLWREDPLIKGTIDLLSLNKRFVLLSYSPTAENLARHIFYQVINVGIPAFKVIVHETVTGFAEFTHLDADDEMLLNGSKSYEEEFEIQGYNKTVFSSQVSKEIAEFDKK